MASEPGLWPSLSSVHTADPDPKCTLGRPKPLPSSWPHKCKPWSSYAFWFASLPTSLAFLLRGGWRVWGRRFLHAIVLFVWSLTLSLRAKVVNGFERFPLIGKQFGSTFPRVARGTIGRNTTAPRANVGLSETLEGTTIVAKVHITAVAGLAGRRARGPKDIRLAVTITVPCNISDSMLPGASLCACFARS